MAKIKFAPLHNFKNNSHLTSFELFPAKKIAAFVLLLILSLFLITPSTPTTASSESVKWSKVNIPTEGTAGNWVLADGSDIHHLTMAIDDTLYAFANPSDTTFTLFKSTDSGYSWSYTGKVTDNIVGIATAPHDASIVYYATTSTIFKSTDAANTFTQLPTPGGAGSNNIEITSIDSAQLGDNSFLAISTTDTDSSQFGGVYILDEKQALPTWTDTNIGNYDTFTIAFSPNFASDHQLVAVATNETDTIVTTRTGDSAWGAITGNAFIENLVPLSASVAFPDDYYASPEDSAFFVAIDTGSGNGDVYMINNIAAPDNSIATDLDIGSTYGLTNVDVSGLAAAGETSSADLLAGAVSSSQVYFSHDSGRNWRKSTKPPTGQSRTHILMTTNFTNSGKAYAASSGSESAISITQDGGATWNQIGLIDTNITNIVDRVISPNYSQDNTLLIFTFGVEHSLWRSLTGGTRWERVFSSALPDVNEINLFRLSPQYGSQAIFLAGIASGNSAIWKSMDYGQNFIARSTRDPTTGTPFGINTWAVANDNTLFIGSFNGKNGLVYYTTDSGRTYSTGIKVGRKPLNTILLSPDYEQDKTIVLGNTDGWVYWSKDNGASFKSLPPDATSPPLTASIAIAFDLEFSSNNTVYAASNNADKYKGIYKGIYRFVINQSTKWVYTLATTAPTLVGPRQDFLVKSNPITGITAPVTFTWNQPSDEVTKYELWIALDNTLEEVVKAITVTETGSPVSVVIGPETNIPLEFIPDTTYFWKVRTFSDGPFKCKWSETRQFNVEKLEATPPIIVEAPPPQDITVEYPPVVVQIVPEQPEAEPPAPSSSTISIYLLWTIISIGAVSLISWVTLTSLGPKAAVSPPQPEATTPQLISPKAGASRVRLKPLFQWSAVTGASSYELLVSTNPSLANPTIIKTGDYALSSTAWWCNVSLNYSTTYYWKVRAIRLHTQSTWSTVGTFTTKPLPPLSSLIPGHRSR